MFLFVPYRAVSEYQGFRLILGVFLCLEVLLRVHSCPTVSTMDGFLCCGIGRVMVGHFAISPLTLCVPKVGLMGYLRVLIDQSICQSISWSYKQGYCYDTARGGVELASLCVCVRDCGSGDCGGEGLTLLIGVAR